jgi:hypothetical protein
MATKRRELRHRLVDIQANIADEMSIFSTEIDLERVAAAVTSVVEKGTTLPYKLFAFAAIDCSPDPADVTRVAAEAVENSLARLFHASHVDTEGKTIHRSSAISDNSEQAALRDQIAQTESIRRHISAFGKIEPARQAICQKHFVSEDILRWFLERSPFVASGLEATFSRGFLRFFQGDFVSALYIDPAARELLAERLKAVWTRCNDPRRRDPNPGRSHNLYAISGIED